jgi:hypothetical protein
VRCKSFSSTWLMRSCINVSGLRLERVVLRAIMDISARAISLADRPRTGHRGHQCSHAPGRPILHRRLILSQTSAGTAGYLIGSSSFRAVPLFVPCSRSFVPTCGCRRAARKEPSRLAVARALPCASMRPGHALTGPRTARRSSRLGRHRIGGLDARKGAPLVENRPGDAGELVGQRNGEHVVM